MKSYKKITFADTGNQNDLLIALLAQQNFDSFEEVSENELIAYIELNEYPNLNLSEALGVLPSTAELDYKVSDMEPKNWNQVWEDSFQPIIIDEKCVVKADFHEVDPLEYNITIAPKMAFGTGHHATTYMMMSFMLTMDFENKDVLDFGCGTAILSILAEKRGAKHVFGNDIETEAAENAVETSMLNSCKNIEIAEGGIEVVPNKQYDIILANVNTVAIKQNLSDLKKHLKSGGSILLSGILVEKSTEIQDLASKLGFSFTSEKEKDNWVALQYSL